MLMATCERLELASAGGLICGSPLLPHLQLTTLRIPHALQTSDNWKKKCGILKSVTRIGPK